MSRLDYGNNLGTPELQPGWTVSADGFGLVQIRAQYKWDYNFFIVGGSETGYFKRGVPFTITRYNYCRMFKYDYVVEKSGIVTITAEYVGVDPEYNVEGGFITLPQVQMVGSSSAEDISHHPNFIQVNCVSNGLANPLAGPPPPGGIFDTDGFSNPNRALWTPIVANQGALNNCQFVGFLPSNSDAAGDINIKAGVKSYYKPQATLRVLLYVSAGSEAAAASLALTKASYVGWTTNGSLFHLPEEYKKLAQSTAYPGNFTYTAEYDALINRSFLITNCSVEKFGWVYKVTADLMLSGIAGWDKDIYPKVGGLG
jgi:hypothetical protein